MEALEKWLPMLVRRMQVDLLVAHAALQSPAFSSPVSAAPPPTTPADHTVARAASHVALLHTALGGGGCASFE